MNDQHWNDLATMTFVGRKIVSAQYMSQTEAKKYGWYGRPLILNLDDGNFIHAMSDDEGNDGGALTTATDLFPVL